MGSGSIFTPTNQVRLTNVSVVRLRRNGVRLEIACYKNKVLEWRSGVERDIDNVLQTRSVFTNVSKGAVAPTSTIASALGTTIVASLKTETECGKDDAVITAKCGDDNYALAACLEILKRGELQVSNREREHAAEHALREVAARISSSCVNPETLRPYPASMIERMLAEAKFSPAGYLGALSALSSSLAPIAQSDANAQGQTSENSNANQNCSSSNDRGKQRNLQKQEQKLERQRKGRNHKVQSLDDIELESEEQEEIVNTRNDKKTQKRKKGKQQDTIETIDKREIPQQQQQPKPSKKEEPITKADNSADEKKPDAFENAIKLLSREALAALQSHGVPIERAKMHVRINAPAREPMRSSIVEAIPAISFTSETQSLETSDVPWVAEALIDPSQYRLLGDTLHAVSRGRAVLAIVNSSFFEATSKTSL